MPREEAMPDLQQSSNESLIEIHEESTSTVHSKPRRPNLSLQIPPHYMHNGSLSSFKKNAPLTPGSARGSSHHGLPPRPSFKHRTPSSDGERSVLLSHEASSHKLFSPRIEDRIPSLKSYSLKKILAAFSSNKSSSLPATPVAKLSRSISETPNEGKSEQISRQSFKGKFARSFSLPLNLRGKRLQKSESTGVFMLIKSSSHTDIQSSSVATQNENPTANSGNEEESEKIPEEEAICRICWNDLCEGGKTLQMECSCKGDLALAHEECAIKWFTIKGNKICDVCRQEVQNLPVTLLRLQNIISQEQQLRTNNNMQTEPFRVWRDVPILVMISMLAYFCFFEQLLVSELKYHSLVIALPCALILGFLSSVTASTMVSKQYIWAYSAFQFALVILFLYIFYSVIELKPIFAVLLASFTGFGISMSISALVVEFTEWHRRHRRTMENLQP